MCGTATSAVSASTGPASSSASGWSAFILTLIEADHFWIANAMYLVFAAQAIVGAVIKLIAYRRGF